MFNDAPNNVFSLLGEETVNSMLNDVEGYWRDMPWTEDGKNLWFFIKSYNPVLLTTPALSVKDCKQDKISWKNGDHKNQIQDDCKDCNNLSIGGWRRKES